MKSVVRTVRAEPGRYQPGSVRTYRRLLPLLGPHRARLAALVGAC